VGLLAGGRDKAAAEAAVDAIAAEINRLDSRWPCGSRRAKWPRPNASAGSAAGCHRHADLGDVIGLALDAARASQGSFDPTVGPAHAGPGIKPRS